MARTSSSLAKERENWTENHRSVARKIFFGRCLDAKETLNLDLSDTSQCHACKNEEGTEKHKLYHCPEWYEVRREIPEVFRKLEQEARTSRRSGSGKEVLLNVLSVEIHGTRGISV